MAVEPDRQLEHGVVVLRHRRAGQRGDELRLLRAAQQEDHRSPVQLTKPKGT